MRKLLPCTLLALIVFGFSSTVFAQNRVVISDADLVGDTDYYWTADNIYELDKLVFLEAGSRLFIEPGTRIEGSTGSNLDASALVITRGAQIFAEGTPTNPIIFTSTSDDGTFDETNRGEWGGLVVLGNATTNNASEKEIEGVGTITPDGDDRAFYGGNDDMDNSGVLRYVSIRHSGKSIGAETGNEIQGLTVGGVGAGTTIEYVESFASDDDGFEFFGGTVNTRYLVSAFNADDAFDWDSGFRGKHQFWFAIQAGDKAGRVAEMDGAGGNENTTPFAFPMVANATYIGAGVDATPEGDGSQMLMFRDNTGGFYYNSIFTDFGSSGDGTAITVEDIDNAGDKPFDSRQRLENDSLIVGNSVWFGFKAGNGLADFAPQDFVQTMLGANGNEISDPALVGVDRTVEGGGLDPRPGASSPALTIDLKDMDDSFFRPTTYAGAFGPTNNWMKGWTTLDEYGYLGDVTNTPGSNRVVISDADLVGDTDYYWTADNIYELDKLVFLEAGSRLFIEPGTRIEGSTGSNLDASALVITRGAQIFAEGTPTNPIIFTSTSDDGTFDETNRGEWGGLVVLGYATTNNASEKEIEGVGTITPDGDDRAFYGGNDDMDNSGVLRYVSIRHSGKSIGAETGNEIQGLTVGAVGAGTTIEYVESFASDDDGFEFFGGTVNTRYLVSAFNADDAFDWDQGFRGKHQFWFAIQAGDKAGRVAEMDGAGGNENTTPFAFPMVANATYIGAGVDATPEGDGSQMLMFRDNTGGFYYNSIFTDFGSSGDGTAITVEDIDNAGDKPFDSRQRLENDSLIVGNSVWFGFKAGNGLADFAPQDFVQTMLGANGNEVSDPLLVAIDRTVEAKGLDPRPQATSPALTITLNDMGDTFFATTDYAGAFGTDSVSWIKGWTTLDEYGYISDDLTAVNNEIGGFDTPKSISLDQNYPNPFNPSTNISFALPTAQNITLKVYDMLGREVATLFNNQRMSAGVQTISFDASGLSSGVYIYRLVGANTTITKRMTLIK